MAGAPLVVRLNSITCPPLPEERAMLAAVGAQMTEIEEISERAEECDALMVVSARLPARLIEGLRRCKVISRLGTGVDRIDLEAATRAGIMVTNLPDFCTEEVADHTLALLLAAARQLSQFQEQMRQGKPPAPAEGLRRLSTQVLGLVGLGRIGRAVARRARAFGMQVLAVDPGVSAQTAEQEGVGLASLEGVLAAADYLCLLCPLTAQTRHLLGRRELALMKPTAVLINTARGELVDEQALVEALQQGTIRYAALDVYEGINVFSPGGFPTDHPLFGLPNVLMTPHVAAYSVESGWEQKVGGAQAVVDVLSGVWPRHLVNAEVVPWFEIARPPGR